MVDMPQDPIKLQLRLKTDNQNSAKCPKKKKKNLSFSGLHRSGAQRHQNEFNQIIVSLLSDKIYFCVVAKIY